MEDNSYYIGKPLHNLRYGKRPIKKKSKRVRRKNV